MTDLQFLFSGNDRKNSSPFRHDNFTPIQIHFNSFSLSTSKTQSSIPIDDNFTSIRIHFAYGFPTAIVDTKKIKTLKINIITFTLKKLKYTINIVKHLNFDYINL